MAIPLFNVSIAKKLYQLLDNKLLRGFISNSPGAFFLLLVVIFPIL